MLLAMSNVTLSVILTAAGLTAGILVGLYKKDFLSGAITGFGFALIGLVIDLNLKLASIPTILPPLITSYSTITKDKGDLFRLAATQKYQETERFFNSLLQDRLELKDLTRVYDLLKFLYGELDSVKKICAVSSREWPEWQAEESWWPQAYFKLHDQAYRRGIFIERIFLFDSEDEKSKQLGVLNANIEHHVNVYTMPRNVVSDVDLNLTSNCLIFFDHRDRPLYGLSASHDKFGRFYQATFYRDPDCLQHLADAYGRMIANADRYISPRSGATTP